MVKFGFDHYDVCHFRLIWKVPHRPPLLLVDIKESIYTMMIRLLSVLRICLFICFNIRYGQNHIMIFENLNGPRKWHPFICTSKSGLLRLKGGMDGWGGLHQAAIKEETEIR